MKLNIGETIKRQRKERKITQDEFAQVLGTSCYPAFELVPAITTFLTSPLIDLWCR